MNNHSMPYFTPQANKQHQRVLSNSSKLRLLKKCTFCQNKLSPNHAMHVNLQRYDVMDDFFNANVLCHSLAMQGEELRDGCEKQDEWKKIEWKSFGLWSSLNELGGLAHYYRFYEHIPVMPTGNIFNMLVAYKNKKKVIQYNRIWLKYNAEKSGNGSTKYKTTLLESERMLKGLSHDQSYGTQQFLTLIEELEIEQEQKNLQQIDQQYCFSKKKKTHPLKCPDNKKKGKKKKQKMFSSQMFFLTGQKKSEKGHKRHFKSCESIDGKSVNIKTESVPLTRSPVLKKKMKHIETKSSLVDLNLSPNKKKIKSYITNLKKNIKREKSLLKKSMSEEDFACTLKMGKQLKINDKIGKSKNSKVFKIIKSPSKTSKHLNRFPTKSCAAML